MGINIMTKKNKDQKEKLLSGAEKVSDTIHNLNPEQKLAIKTGLIDASNAGDSAPAGTHLNWKESIKLFFHNLPAKFMAFFKATAPLAISAGEKVVDDLIDNSKQPEKLKELQKSALDQVNQKILDKIDPDETTSADLPALDITDTTSHSTSLPITQEPVVVTADNTDNTVVTETDTKQAQTITLAETDPVITTDDSNRIVINQTTESTYVAPVEDHTQTFAEAIGQVVENSSAMMV